MASHDQTTPATTPDASHAAQPDTISAAPTPLAPAPTAKAAAKRVVATPVKKVPQPVKATTTTVVKPAAPSVAKKTPTPTKPVAKAATAKTPATKTAAQKNVAKPAVKAAPAVAARVATKSPAKAEPKAVIATTTKHKIEKLLKAKKPKLVRDSFTIPKLEYLILEELKQRGGKLGNTIKKSELIRAGIKALAAMSDASLLAAREIKALIGASAEKVKLGTVKVHQARESMNHIVESVGRVTDVIAEIHVGSTAQSSSMSSINMAISSLDQMTQQNAAVVEESAAAAQNLQDQARGLRDVAGRFRLPTLALALR